MVALANTQLGAGMTAAHVQVYGWVEVGGNVSTNSVKLGGNAPVGTQHRPARPSSRLHRAFAGHRFNSDRP
jgi:hypothetical protein